ncbi:hypothetical protein Q7P35_006661 [Cladosporium inversicolor]
MPTTDAEHEAFDNGLRSRALSPEQNPAHDQTGNATDERDPDPMDTPSPPRTRISPPGRTPHLPHFGHLPPPPAGDFVPHSAVFHPAHPPPHPMSPPMPPHPPFPHPPPMPPKASAHHPPHGGFAHLPPTSTTRPQAPIEREAGDPFTHPPPPFFRWNDNDNA